MTKRAVICLQESIRSRFLRKGLGIIIVCHWVLFEEMNRVFFQLSDGRATVIPCHTDEEIGQVLLCRILRDIGMKPELLSTY